MRRGASLQLGGAILVGLVVRLSFKLPIAKLVIPIAVLATLQIACYIGMYPARKRYRRTGDLRAGFILMGLYGLLVGLASMYYAGKLGLVRVTTFTENYVGFTIYMIVVVCTGIGFLSLLKTTRTPA